MPYRNIENMSRRGEKIAPFITLENMVGLIVAGVIGYGLSVTVPGMWRTLVIATCLLLGYIATGDAKGMARYQRVLWLLRGMVRSALHGTMIAPDDLPGSAMQQHIPVARQGGLVRLRSTQASLVQARQVRSAQQTVAALKTNRRTPQAGD